MATTELSVQGMSCASCVAHVTDALRGVPGVEDASVNLAAERAIVQGEADPRALIAAIVKAGYEASADLHEDRIAAEREAELRSMRRLLVLAIVLTVPAVGIGMFAPPFPYEPWLLAALALPVWAFVGYRFHRGALAALRTGTATMDTLVSLGSTAAFISGAFDTAAAIVTLIFLGKYLEARARRRSSNAMRELLALRPATAQRRNADGSFSDIAVDDVRVDDDVVVRMGDRIPVDGTVLEGTSTIDRSMLTGESLPIDVSPGAALEAGTLNGAGTLVMRVTAVGEATELARIAAIVRRAQGSLPPVQRLADRVASVFVPVIIGIALVTLVGWMLLGHVSLLTALGRAVAVLVVACPCALGLATPTAVIAGIGAAARAGVLFKDADTLERCARVTTVLFDKTGTLTLGAAARNNDQRNELRDESREAVTRLHALGIRSELVSGDAEAPVMTAAHAVGIETFHARVTPEEKFEILTALRARGERVGFVGDGINDAPVLAGADIGFAMGGGTAVALEAAGAALLRDDPRAVAAAIVLARATMRTIRQNLFWAFAYNAALVPLAAFGVVPPIFAAAAMGLSSLFVVANALRLARAYR
jgi:P-type Cu2+ transporter